MKMTDSIATHWSMRSAVTFLKRSPCGRSLWSSVSTKLSYETAKGNYFEFRRNYEQDGTIACSAGRSFSGEGRFSWAITPIAGFAVGMSQGLSLGVNTTLEHKKLSF